MSPYTDALKLMKSIKRTLTGLVLATIVLYGALGLVAWKTYIYSHDSQRSLCVLRSDLEQRVKSSKEFLQTHPNGAFGIPANVIRDGIVNQQRTIAALKDLDC